MATTRLFRSPDGALPDTLALTCVVAGYALGVAWMTVHAWLPGDVIALSGWVAPKTVLLNLVAHMIMLHVPHFAGA